MAASIHSSTCGVFVIAATPFTDSGAIDFESIDTLTDFYLSFGIDGLTILGIMGEAQKLSQDESLAVMHRFLQRVNGRVPVIVGASAPAFDPMVSLSKAAMDAGIPGILVGHMAVPGIDKERPNRPAALSPRLLQLLVRQDWQYQPESLLVFIGGLGSFHGAIFGAAFIIALPQVIVFMKDYLPAAIGQQTGLQPTIFGLILMAFLLFEPLGLYGRWVKVRTYLELFPYYRGGMFARQRSFQKSERTK